MSDANDLRIADGVSLLFRWKTCRETTQIGEFRPKLYLWSVHQDGKDGLRGTGIIDNLICEEKFRVVVGESLRLVIGRYPLEQEDQSVDGPAKTFSWLINLKVDSEIDLLDLVEFLIFKSHQLFNLDPTDSNLMDQLTEDACQKVDKYGIEKQE